MEPCHPYATAGKNTSAKLGRDEMLLALIRDFCGGGNLMGGSVAVRNLMAGLS
jgi:hypothetical protein